jgi:predicted alpha/beta-fold hydrolase
VVCLLTVASSIVLLTDTLYVLEFGPQYGFTLFCLAVVLTWRCMPNRRMRSTIVLMVVLVAILTVDTSSWSLVFGEPADHVEISEGLYYHSENTRAQAIAQSWPQNTWDYAKQDATPWIPTGDARTGLPFILNKDRVPNPDWTRVWMPTSDGEVVALDWSFPTDGHDTTQPVYFVLHGLNGGSNEEYVKDFTHRRNAERSTVVVMIARGLQDLPVRGWDIFHGARWTDAHQASQKVKEVLVPRQMLAGVGFSMGAIIMANLVTRAGNECALDAAVAISGGLDMRFETHFHRAQRLWQPMLTTELRDTFVVGKWGERVRHRLSKDQLKKLMRATHISEVDRTAVVAYNGFDDLNVSMQRLRSSST